MTFAEAVDTYVKTQGRSVPEQEASGQLDKHAKHLRRPGPWLDDG